MHFLKPQASWLLLLLVIPVVLYLLPLPRHRRLLPSILLWLRVAQRQGLTARRNILRLVGSIVTSVLVLVLIIGAYGRLVIGRPPRGTETGLVVVVLDTSASMQATEGAASRFERARGHAGILVEGLRPRTRAALVTTAPAPRLRVRPTTEAAALTEALRQLAASDAPGSVAAALAWIEKAFAGEEVRVHVFTDGACETPESKLTVTWHLFGGDLGNAGIVAFGVRRIEVPEPSVFVHARIGNFSDTPRSVELVLSRDAAPLEPKPVELPAESVTSLSWRLPKVDAGLLKLVMRPGDGFSLDDSAAAVLAPLTRKRVILVAEKPPIHLLAALRANSSVQTFMTKPENYRPGLGSALTVFVNTLPAQMGRESVLLVNPPSSGPLVKLAGATAPVGAVTHDPMSPLLRHVTWRTGFVRKISSAETPTWAEAALTSPAGPLLLAGMYEGRRAVVLSFDPETEPLARTRTFPILVSNIIDYLVPQRTDASLVRAAHGAPVGSTAAGPPRQAEGRQGGRTTRIREPASVVNLCDADESDLRPRLKVDRSASAAGGMPPAFLWTCMIVAAVVLLAVEAILYHRRILE
ncbi:MAG: hypothetical protein AMK75_03945 [Planctomycetes bacterium SM23_65]|nr:MAG: hypothetical protein AMK75_03945 [Planctomycetes bacterium SM23_65]